MMRAKNHPCLFKRVIFDMDGVLIDSEPLHYKAEDIIFEHMKISPTKKMRRSFTGISNDLMWQTLKKSFSLTPDIRELKEEAETIRLTFFSELQGLSPIEGVSELLTKLTGSGTPIALASSSDPDLIELLLARTGLSRYFPHRVSGEEVAAGKPAPDVFLADADRLKTLPEQCGVIEDSENGIRAARAAGMTVYAFTGAAKQSIDTSLAERAFTSFADISSALFEEK